MTSMQRTAVRNLALLHQEATPEAVQMEIERLGRAARLAGCLFDLRRVP